MKQFKHVGRIKATGRKCLVVFRTLPGDSSSCLVVLTENLNPTYHDALMSLVDSAVGQDAYEFSDALNRNIFPDGMNMLQSLHVQGLLSKWPTDKVEMTPTPSSSILLSELNALIAEQQGVSVNDLSIRKTETEIKEVAHSALVADPISEEVTESAHAPMSDEDLAKKYRSDADRLSKEAAALRRMAEELVPTKKKKEQADSTSTTASS